MANEKIATQDMPVEHIGAAPHPQRNLYIGVGVVLMAAIIAVFYWQSSNSAGAASAELDKFRQAMFGQCKNDQFDGPTPPQLASLYADSSRMRAVVMEQYNILQHGKPDCDQVMKSLRSVDYPIR